MANWYRLPSSSRMTEGEYQANIQGINIVFGAVLGFVLAEAGNLPPADFAIVLFVSASAVISLGSSSRTMPSMVAAARPSIVYSGGIRRRCFIPRSKISCVIACESTSPMERLR